MSDFTPNTYRMIVAVAVVLILFVAGRPYFSARARVAWSAAIAGIGNSLIGGALMGTPLSGLPLRFAIAFLGVGAGVALFEYLLPEGRPGNLLRRWRRGGSVRPAPGPAVIP